MQSKEKPTKSVEQVSGDWGCSGANGKRGFFVATEIHILSCGLQRPARHSQLVSPLVAHFLPTWLVPRLFFQCKRRRNSRRRRRIISQNLSFREFCWILRSSGRGGWGSGFVEVVRSPVASELRSMMPSPFGAFGLQNRPLRCGGGASGQIAQGERCFRTVSQFDGGSLESVSGSGLQCRERNQREQGRGLLLTPPLSLSRGRLSKSSRLVRESVERNGHGGPVMALGGGGRDMGDKADETGEMQAQWNVNLASSSSSSSPDVDASWEQISMAFRICYSVAMYGGLAFAGHVICSFTGVDLWGGFELSPEVITTGFGFAVPPMMALLFILEDEIVKSWGPARAIRDVEDEELLEFFAGMSPWQFPFVVAAGAIAEELFFRVAIQGGLTHALQVSDKGVTESTVGLAALTGVIPLFVPFSQFFATALTAALTSSMYYVMTSPKDPKYVVAPVARGRNNRGDIKQRVSAWYERRQQKKIYSPLVEGLLAMYLGFEWMHTGNILAPIVTHTLYSLVIVGTGLRRIHDNRDKLRQRVSKISGERLARLENRSESS